ncbi:hypothetical protein [Wolbachia pipientis]|uniref:hypothetical protein n=1 Tax=Wolbachia pipientis TaxID=955 RepID=UPI0025A342F5|nr:hypothetical protein [Wolbachia pipientis]MDM8335651.1 hypothetical protein [Wolbachia pipientis]
MASEVFAVAPYVSFLTLVAALNVSLPFIIGCATFSAITIALSSVAINKNNTISEKDTEISNSGKSADSGKKSNRG